MTPSSLVLQRAGDGALVLFTVGADQSVYCKRQTGPNQGDWSRTWTCLGDNTIPGPITAGTDRHGRVVVFVRAMDDSIYWKTQLGFNSDPWSAWNDLGDNTIRGPIAVAANSDGRLVVLVRAMDDSIYWKVQGWRDSNLWSPGWNSLGDNTIPGPIAVATNQDGRLVVLVRAMDDSIYWKAQLVPNSDAWSPGWNSLGDNTIPGPIAVARNQDGRLVVLVRAMDDSIYWKAQLAPNSDAWSPGWNSLGDNTIPGPIAVATNQDGRLVVLVRAMDDSIYWKAQLVPNSDAWSPGWNSLGDNTIPGPIAACRGLGERLVVAAYANDGAIYIKSQTSANSPTWPESWSKLGVPHAWKIPVIVQYADTKRPAAGLNIEFWTGNGEVEQSRTGAHGETSAVEGTVARISRGRHTFSYPETNITSGPTGVALLEIKPEHWPPALAELRKALTMPTRYGVLTRAANRVLTACQQDGTLGPLIDPTRVDDRPNKDNPHIIVGALLVALAVTRRYPGSHDVLSVVEAGLLNWISHRQRPDRRYAGYYRRFNYHNSPEPNIGDLTPDNWLGEPSLDEHSGLLLGLKWIAQLEGGEDAWNRISSIIHNTYDNHGYITEYGNGESVHMTVRGPDIWVDAFPLDCLCSADILGFPSGRNHEFDAWLLHPFSVNPEFIKQCRRLLAGC